MIQSILALVTVCLASFYLAYRYYKQWSTKKGCSNCSMGKSSQND